MRRLWMVCAVCAVVAVGGEASADELWATLGEPIEEVAHEVDATVRDGAVTYVVRRTFRNAGARHEEAVLSIKLPPQAAATGLRIRAEDRWYDGELMEANKAAELYQELTGMGPHTPRDPALLAWRWADELSLRVFPVPPGGIATIEYTLTAPASYEQGRYNLWYPMSAAAGEEVEADAASRPLAKVTMRVSPPAGRLVELGGALYPAETSIPLAQVEPHPGCGAALEAMGSDGSCALSELVVPDGAAQAGAVRLRATIKHTWRSDLMVALRSPDGQWATLVSNEGGDTNDLVLDRELPLPHGTSVSGAWQLVVSDTAGLDVGVLSTWSLEVGKQRYASAQPVVIPDAPSAGGALMAALSVAPGKIDMVAGRLGRVIAAAGKELMRLEVDVAPKLSELPKQAAVVFVLDASWSMGERGIAAQLEVVRAYMGHVPDARVEIVVVRRGAAPLFGRFVPAAELGGVLAKVIEEGALEPGNGSALDAGVASAAALLGKERGERRLVALSDLLLRPSLEAKAGIKQLERLDKGVIVHLVKPEWDNEAWMERDDAEPWSGLATRHGGIFARLHGANGEEPTLKGLSGVVLGLVRPLQIDAVVWEGATSVEELGEVRAVREGQGVRVMTWMKQAPQQIVMRGKLWSKPVQRVIRVGDADSRRAAAYVFSHDMYDMLSEAEQLKVAFFGRVVSPVTSYLAIEPGVRPSTAGIDREGRGFGAGGLGMRGSGMGGGGGVYEDPMAAFEAAWRRCSKLHPKVGPVELTVHTTLREIVDVLPTGSDALTMCVADVVWGVRLHERYARVERDTIALQW